MINVNTNTFKSARQAIPIANIEAWYYNLPLSDGAIPDKSLNGFYASLLSGCFSGNNSAYYHKATTLNLGTKFKIEFYANIKTITNNSNFTGNSSTIATGRIIKASSTIILRQNSTNISWASALSGKVGVNKIRIERDNTDYSLYLDDVFVSTQSDVSATGDFIIDNIGNDGILLQDDIWALKIWNSSDVLIHYLPLEPVTGDIQYDVVTGDVWTLINGVDANYGTQTTSRYISTYGCTYVIKSDETEYQIVPYDQDSNPIYDHSSPIWDANETHTEHAQNGSKAIPGTYISLPEETDLIASCATMLLQDWFDVSDNAIPVLVEDINPLEEGKQYFDVNNYKNLIIIKLANQ